MYQFLKDPGFKSRRDLVNVLLLARQRVAIPIDHICERFRIVGIQECLLIFEGGVQVMQFASTSNRGRFCILYSHAKWTVRVSTRSTSFALRASTVAFTSKKVIMNTSTHNLPSSSLRWKVPYFLLSRIYKLDSISCNDNFFHFFAPEKPRDITSIPSALKRLQNWRVS